MSLFTFFWRMRFKWKSKKDNSVSVNCCFFVTFWYFLIIFFVLSFQIIKIKLIWKKTYLIYAMFSAMSVLSMICPMFIFVFFFTDFIIFQPDEWRALFLILKLFNAYMRRAINLFLCISLVLYKIPGIPGASRRSSISILKIFSF